MADPITRAPAAATLTGSSPSAPAPSGSAARIPTSGYRPRRQEPDFPEVRGLNSWLLLALVLAIAWFVRARDFSFATAYMDESLYIDYGRMFLSHDYQWPLDHPLRWTWGWYLWPAMSALADRFGGLVGVRALSAALGVVTVGAVFGLGRRLFSPTVGLASALVVALLAPAVFSARIATRDSASVPFFALGLWAFAAAWENNKARYWLAAAAGMLAAFLCKYVVAIYFPVLVLMSLKKGRKPLFLFSAILTVACSAYLLFYWNDLMGLLEYGRQYHQLAIKQWPLLWENYVSRRIDLWFLFALALVTLPFLGKDKLKSGLLLLGAVLFFAFQWRTRADRDFWKHAMYPLLFLVPAAMAGVIALLRRVGRPVYVPAAFIVVPLLAVALGWSGKAWSMEDSQDWAQRAVWPDADPILIFLHGKLSPESRVLADDNVFRYYLQPPLHQSHIADPFFFKYGGQTGDPAYVAAVRDGYFDYIVFDTGVGEEAEHLARLIRPLLAPRYESRMRVFDAVLGHPLEIFARVLPPPVPGTPPAPVRPP